LKDDILRRDLGWRVSWAKLIDRAGWPVIRLQKGDWPIDPRLLPGSPVASPKLREEGEEDESEHKISR